MLTSSNHASIMDTNQLRKQNEQLWKIIERQRTTIQALQKENSLLITERDGLQDKVNAFEHGYSQQRTLVETIQVDADEKEQQSPMPPTRSPYRANNNNKHEQDQQPKRSPNCYGTSNTTLFNNDKDIPPTTTSPHNNNNKAFSEKETNRQIVSTQHCLSSPLLLSPSPSSCVVPVSTISSPIITSAQLDTSLSSGMVPSLPSVVIVGTGHTAQCGGHQSNRKSQLFSSPAPALSGIGLNAPTLPCLDTGDPMNNVNDMTVLDNQPSNINIVTGTSSPLPPLPQQQQHRIYNIASVSSSSVSSFSTSTSSTLLSTGTSSTSLAPSTFASGINNIAIKVLGSNILQNDKHREVISFIISIGRKPDEDSMEFEELWRVEKLYSHFLELDSKIKSSHQSTNHRIAKLPDKALFTTNSPNKADRRKAALEHYLQRMILLPLDDNSDLCEFLSTNVVDSSVTYSRTGRKEGYLTKRGKNFGGWKRRYFVLHGTSLEYYDSREGNHLGTIRLVNAQIGRQTPGASSTTDDGATIYRHAFLIVEQKRSGSSYLSRHILCASSDEERDSWVDALFKIVCLEDEKQQQRGRSPSTEPTCTVDHGVSGKKKKKAVSGKSGANGQQQHGNDLGSPPPPPSKTNISSSSLSVSSAGSPPPIVFDQRTSLDHDRPSPMIPSNGYYKNNSHSLQQRPTHRLTRRSSMVNLLNTNDKDMIVLPARAVSPSPAFNRQSDDLLGSDLPEKKTKHKRMTFWGKKMFSSSNDDLMIPANNSTIDLSTCTTTTASPSSSSSSLCSSSGFRGFLSRPSHENGYSSGSKGNNQPPLRPVFGVSLDESVQVSRVSDSYQLPSIVFRCIEYLDAKKAVLEEGLYRLSGSNVMMKSLKQRFNLEGDINLLAEREEYDVHAIAGLLKMWLRELPTGVLTREHRMDFLHVIDLMNQNDRVKELGRLVSLLPITNYTLLRALTAHLRQVIQHSDINKMTMRNVSIVFSPTLGIPGIIFNLLICEFDYIFWTTDDTTSDDNKANDNLQIEETSTVEKTGGNDDDDVGSSVLGRRPTLQLRDGRSNRNSVDYREAAPDSIVDLEKHQGQQLKLDDSEDDEVVITDEEDSMILDDDSQTTIG
ncbi:hypothetical protein BC941DRAFT_428373 [Chlamydoabsidia padenii]|nr:hypothetical protein BC941DRAFT_428373 [Chlamydoabsidia padenii]